MLFRIMGSAFWLYSFICSIRIVLTWLPGMDNGFTRFLSNLCDPYLNFFSRRGILRIGMLDFSPILALALLSLGAMICNSLGYAAGLSFSILLHSIVSTAWSIVSSIAGFLTLIFIIRFIFLLLQNNSYNGSSFWRMIDTTFNQIIFGIANTFSRGKMIPFKTALLIDIITLIVLNVAGNLFINKLLELIKIIPF